jgi:hypothetical protein
VSSARPDAAHRPFYPTAAQLTDGALASHDDEAPKQLVHHPVWVIDEVISGRAAAVGADVASRHAVVGADL